jgi:hypothetical protein
MKKTQVSKAVYSILLAISPITNLESFSYTHKQFYEFYVAQSIIEETLNAQSQAID